MYLRAAVAVVIAVLIAGFGWKCYVLGKHSVQAKWDAEKAAVVIAAAERERQAQATADFVARTVHRHARQDQAVYRQLRKESAHVPNDCPLPAAVGVLHDAAATGTELPDRGSSVADGAAVTAESITATVIDNYESCRDSMRRLDALQQLIRAYNGD